MGTVSLIYILLWTNNTAAISKDSHWGIQLNLLTPESTQVRKLKLVAIFQQSDETQIELIMHFVQSQFDE